MSADVIPSLSNISHDLEPTLCARLGMVLVMHSARCLVHTVVAFLFFFSGTFFCGRSASAGADQRACRSPFGKPSSPRAKMTSVRSRDHWCQYKYRQASVTSARFFPSSRYLRIWLMASRSCRGVAAGAELRRNQTLKKRPTNSAILAICSDLSLFKNVR